ncbi:MAG TPA: hypothetical protein VGC67_11785 [Cellulomonas sp.]
MESALTNAAPLVIAAVVSGLIAAISPLLSTSRRLRDELVRETQILTQVPPSARSQLRAEIGRRTHTLVSLTRYPPVTRWDVLVLAMYVTSPFTILFILKNTSFEDSWTQKGPALVVTVLAPLAMISSWRSAYTRWSRRAEARLRYLESHVGHGEACAAARMVQIGDALISVAGLPLLAWISAEVAVLCSTFMAEWACSVAAIACLVASFVVVYHTLNHSDTLSPLINELLEPKPFWQINRR